MSNSRDHSELSGAVRSAQFFWLRVTSQLDQLRRQTYPAGQKGTQALLNLIEGVLATSLTRLETAFKETDEKKLTILLADSFSLTRQAYMDMGHLRGADIGGLGYENVLPFQHWFRLLKNVPTVFFRAENIINYEIRPFPEDKYKGIRDKAHSLVRAIDSVDWPLSRVTVPSKALGILPHFAIVAHEFGHSLYRELLHKNISKALSLQTSLVDKAMKNHFNRVKVMVPSITHDKWFRATLVKFLPHWIEEIACDSIAFCITGPAIYFALSELLQFGDGSDTVSPSHPPHFLGRSLLFRLLGRVESDYIAVIKKHTGNNLIEHSAGALITPTPSPEKIWGNLRKHSDLDDAESAVLAHLPEAAKELGLIVCAAVLESFESLPSLKGKKFTADDLDAALSAHLGALIEAIPPIENGGQLENREPSSIADILNVGWVVLMFKLEKMKIDPSESNKALEFGARSETLHSLLAKGLGLSEVRRLWNELNV